MKNRKVKRVAFHIGVNVNSNVRTSLDSERHASELTEMTITQVGLLVTDKTGMDTLVPFANCHWIMLEPEEGPGPGRPKKMDAPSDAD